MQATSTEIIVDALTRAIAERRLQPGAKLVEQKLADQFGVSRTIVRQALFRLSQSHLVRMEPARGAFVAAPSEKEAQQVLEVRRLLEASLVRAFVRDATPDHLEALRAHLREESLAVQHHDAARITALLGDFHVRMAELIGQTVLAQLLSDMVARCILSNIAHQTDHTLAASHQEHEALLAAFELRDEALALRLMDEHLQHVSANLNTAAA